MFLSKSLCLRVLFLGCSSIWAMKGEVRRSESTWNKKTIPSQKSSASWIKIGGYQLTPKENIGDSPKVQPSESETKLPVQSESLGTGQEKLPTVPQFAPSLKEPLNKPLETGAKSNDKKNEPEFPLAFSVAEPEFVATKLLDTEDITLSEEQKEEILKNNEK